MSQETTPNWYDSNSDYLLLAVESVHQLLKSTLTTEQNTPPPPTPDFKSALAATAAEMSAPPALEHLCTTFHLTPFEHHILLLCTAQAIISDFPSLCATAHGNAHMDYPTFGLALKIFPDAHWSATTPTSPLLYWQLLHLEPHREPTLSRLQIDSSILHYLMGEPYTDHHLIHQIQPLEATPTTPLPESHHQIASRLSTLLTTPETKNLSLSSNRVINTDTNKNHPPSVTIQLCGTEPSAIKDIATTACTWAHRPLKVLSANRLPTLPDELTLLLRRWHRDATLTNSILLLDCSTSESTPPSAITQLLQQITTPLIITSSERIYSPHRPLITFDIPKLSHHEQLTLWQTLLGSLATELNGHLETLVGQFNLNSAAISAACLSLHSEIEKSPDGEIETNSPISNQLWNFCRILARPHLEDLAQRIETTATWDDLVLPQQQRQTLRDIATHLRQRTKVYLEWGFAGKSNRGLGISALFSGPSGTGKTMAAEVLAQELHLDLYRIDLSAVVSKYIGETEKNLRRIFDAAETGGAILLFDEADALFGKRTQVKDSHDRHANVEVSYLLQRMEAYTGLAILTTNLKESLDQAFLRRIRFIVKFPFPDPKSRIEIWQRIFPKPTPTSHLDYTKLGNLSVAGGNIRSIALNAAFIAADSGEPVMMKHILQATKSEYVKLERSLTSTEIKDWV